MASMRARMRFGALGAVGFLAAASAAPARPLLSAHVPEMVSAGGAARIGEADPARMLHLSVSLPLRDEGGLDALLTRLYDPASAQYRRYLTVAQFTRSFGPSQADYQAAAAYFRAAGFQVSADAANRFLILLSGGAGLAERVFHVRLGLWRDAVGGREFFAPDREPSLDLTTPILHVTGLDDAEPPAPRHVLDFSRGDRAGSGPKRYYLGSDARTAYYGGGPLDGAGQTLGLMELAGYDLSDVETYFTRFGPPLTAKVEGVSTDGAPLGCGAGCHDGEQALDIEYAIAMAPGLAAVQVYVGRNAEDVLERMATDNTSAQLSTSWGWAHREAPTDEPLFKEMAAQGQSFLTASGDNCSLKASDPWPEESVNLTAVGGTDLKTDGAGGPWKDETGWSHSAGGPSLDRSILIARYQEPFVTKASMASPTLRNVPDIAAIASNLYICADGHCSGGWGGTSFSSPIWTGFIALANQEAAAGGMGRVGFLNPTLYRLARGRGGGAPLHDIVGGVSGLYSAVRGYDLVTGLGSPDGPALADALAERPTPLGSAGP